MGRWRVEHHALNKALVSNHTYCKFGTGSTQASDRIFMRCSPMVPRSKSIFVADTAAMAVSTASTLAIMQALAGDNRETFPGP